MKHALGFASTCPALVSLDLSAWDNFSDSVRSSLLLLVLLVLVVMVNSPHAHVLLKSLPADEVLA
jgi:hypothetical protein